MTWVPDKGRLVVGPWPDDDGATQVLAKGQVPAWQARWDRTGSVLARLDRRRRTPRTRARSACTRWTPPAGRANLDSPMLDGVPAFAGFSLDTGRLAWSAPGKDGERTVQVLAWSGTTIGQLELQTGGGATVVR